MLGERQIRLPREPGRSRTHEHERRVLKFLLKHERGFMLTEIYAHVPYLRPIGQEVLDALVGSGTAEKFVAKTRQRNGSYEDATHYRVTPEVRAMLTERGRVVAGLAARDEPTPSEVSEIERRKAEIREQNLREMRESPHGGSGRYTRDAKLGRSTITEIPVPDAVAKLPSVNGHAIAGSPRYKTCPECDREVGPGKRHSPECSKRPVPLKAAQPLTALQRTVRGERSTPTLRPAPKPVAIHKPEIMAPLAENPTARHLRALQTIVEALAELPEDLARWVADSAVSLARAEREKRAEDAQD